MSVNLEKCETTAVDSAVDSAVALSIPSGVLRHMFAASAVFAGKDNAIPFLMGINLEWGPGVFRVVSTDRYRMAVGELQGEHVTGSDVAPGSLLVPAKGCADIAKALPKGRGQDDLPVSVLVSSDSVTVTVPGEWSRTITAMDARFPEWQALVAPPKGDPHPTFRVNPHYMADFAKAITGKFQSIEWTIGEHMQRLYGETTSPVGRTEVSWKLALMPCRQPA